MRHDGTRRPNVIVVLTDQQRWDSTGVHGNPLDLTPNFDAVAANGTHLTAAFTPQPVCGPARSALQTGRYATSTGCFRNAIPLPADARTLAHHFGAAGYATGYVGKWHLGSQEPVPTEERGGYQSWLAANALEFTSDAYRTVMFDENDDPVALPGYRSDALFDAAIRYVADQTTLDGERQPFFLFLSTIEPHHQNELDTYPAPEGYAERYQGRWMPPDLATLSGQGLGNAHRHLGGYYGQIRRIDEGFGRLLDALRSLSIADDTVVAFTSDHGCHFKTRNSEYKRSCHEASIHVPLAVRGPGFDGGGAVHRPVSTLDLPPTLLDAAGIEVPAEMQGRSFLPLVHERDAGWPDDVLVQVSESEVGRAVRTTRWNYYVTAPGTDAWNEPAADHYVETALYDLRNDPYELDNLIGLSSHRKVADEMRARLLRRLAEAGEQEPSIELAPERTLSQRQVDPRVHADDHRPVRYGHQARR